jgi:site-specific DNA recombinase
MATPSGKISGPVRCAIYTRKSTEEGLDQEFSSLDAQREAAEAYILSQRTEGWCALPQAYQDGGFSGGGMDRPALARLLADVESGRMDCVVVYKVDRLSRSLLDFARIMGLFEKHQVSFVSVTQQFNTSVPVGRLTLHILLSFAQFEREIISERTRDKKAAAKRKGKWTGGYLPLGYNLDPRGGKLVVNETEAEQVRAIYRRFAETGSLQATLEWVSEQGWTTKGWKTAAGRQRRGSAFQHVSLLRLLQSELYLGMVRYQGQLYPGEQFALVERRLWKRVQEQLHRLPPRGPAKQRNKHGALLQGLLRCGRCGKPMQGSFTDQQGRRYRYYVCSGGSACRNRVAAEAIEEAVVGQLKGAAGKNKDVRRLVNLYQCRHAASKLDLIESVQRILEFASYDAASREIVVRMKAPEAHSAKTRR